MEKFSEEFDNQQSKNAAIFSEIYERNGWGGEKDIFFSGPGSHNTYIPAYAQIISAFVIRKKIFKIVEIGCGDFYVTGAILKNLDKKNVLYSYVGYDCVSELIKYNKKKNVNPSVRFHHKDCCIEEIETGDLLVLRQVLQHLDNNSIQQIVNKFAGFKYIIVSEHQIINRGQFLILPNLDQQTGASIRIERSSGVYLDCSPFNCNIDSTIFSFPEPFYGIEAEIKTFLIVT